MTTDPELERFKTQISIAEFAQAQFGYEKDKSKSSKNSLVLRNGGDSVIISRGEDGHDIYFSRSDSSDSGSIIDFVKNRIGDNNPRLVRVRQALRPWCAGGKRPAPNVPTRPAERPAAALTPKSDMAVRSAGLKRYSGLYLARERKLDPAIIEAFNVREDGHGNACFLHRKAEDFSVTGWETKNAGWTGFSTDGLRGLFMARLGPKVGLQEILQIVITEAAIDAMSHAQMRHEPGTSTLYISTAGSQLSDCQKDSLKRVLAQASAAQVMLAMDRDVAGEAMAKRVRELEPGREMTRELPSNKDWNEDLQQVFTGLTTRQVGTTQNP